MKDNRNLRFTFVQLLFSLAIGQVAIKFSDLIVEDYSWKEFYAYSHLILCVVILSTSWVGFQISKHAENTLTTIFSTQFIILLIDILLVITYFVIVRGAEIKNYPENGFIKLLDPDTHNETFWSMLIFAFYLIWDMTTKLFTSSFVQDGETYVKKYPLNFSSFIDRAKHTLYCLVASIIIYIWALNIKPSHNAAVLIDFALISLFFSFRGLKQEIHPKYQLTRVQMSLPFDEINKEEKLSISDKKHGLKVFVIKRLPIVCLIGFLIALYFCK